jgi:hypothetical protein
MASADFYVGLGEDAEWLGSLSVDGSAAEMDDEGLFGEPDQKDPYTEETYRRIVGDVLAAAVADDYGYSKASGDVWPWAYADSGGTDMVYAFNNGSVHVYERGDGGQYQVALHYPNGTRKPVKFPAMAR